MLWTLSQSTYKDAAAFHEACPEFGPEDKLIF